MILHIEDYTHKINGELKKVEGSKASNSMVAAKGEWLLTQSVMAP
jgi:hypothetical protein